MKALNLAQVIAVITFTIPPGLIAAITYFAGVFDLDSLIKLLTNWPILVFLLPFIAGIPLILQGWFQLANQSIKSQDFGNLKGLRKKIIMSYMLASFVSPFVAIPICYYNDFTTDQIFFTTLIALCYVFAASVPLFIKFISEVDKIFKDIPISFIPITSIRLKSLMVNVSITTGGGALILTAVYCLLWRMVSFPESGFSPQTIFFRLLVITLIVVIFQIVPNMIINSSNIRDIRQIHQFVEEISKKDLTTSISLHSRDEFGEISEKLNILRSNFRDVLNILMRNTSHMSHSSAELNSLSVKLSDTSNGQAANAEEIAASVEETSANIAAATENAEESVNMSVSTLDSVKEGQKLIIGTQKNVQNISEKVVMIQELADQTNLLAINAFIEAANAGDQGKGFAVVAKEIRVLADRSKQSAEEISELASQCVDYSGASVEKSNEMMTYISKTSEMSKLVSNSSKEQYTSIEQINYTVQDFNRSSQTLAASSEELSATSEILIETASELDKILKSFKL